MLNYLPDDLIIKILNENKKECHICRKKKFKYEFFKIQKNFNFCSKRCFNFI